MAHDLTVRADGAWRRWARLGLVLGCAVVVALGMGLAIRAKLYPTPGAMLALDAESGDQIWRVSTPQADHNEVYWKNKRLILRATGSAHDRCARYSDYLAVDRSTGATSRVPWTAAARESSSDPLSREGFVLMEGEVRFGRRSYGLENPEDFDHPSVRASTLVKTGPGKFDWDRRVFWSVLRPDGIEPIATDGQVVLLAPPGPTYPQPGGVQELRALDAHGGRTLWRHPLLGFGTDPEAYLEYPRPILSRGYVYAMTTPTTLSALEIRTGRTAFDAEVGVGEIVLSTHRVGVLSPGRLSVLTRGGQLEWTRTVDPRTSGIALDDRRVYLTVNGRPPSLLFCPSS